jgi:hypothetical protein
MPEARQRAEPALKFERELAGRNADDPSQRLDLALALFAASVAGVGERGPMLTEASALVDRLPPEMRRLSDVAVWRERIAEEQKKRR